jgi:predicted aspartyl protease
MLTGLASVAAAPVGGTIPVEVAGGRCVVTVILDGRPARMILDTGAARSLITRAAALRLGLPFDHWVDTTLRDAGGRLQTHPNADIAAATLGEAPLYQRPTVRSLSLAVASADLGGADGLLGGDVLRHVTFCLDVPGARLTLGVAGRGPPRRGGVRLQTLWPDLLLAPVVLDGCGLLALVDTGSTASVINGRGLYRLGLTPARLARDPIVALAGVNGRLPARLHRFTELRLGSLTVGKPEFLASGVPEGGFDMILGLDILGQQKFCLSYGGLDLVFA